MRQGSNDASLREMGRKGSDGVDARLMKSDLVVLAANSSTKV